MITMAALGGVPSTGHSDTAHQHPIAGDDEMTYIAADGKGHAHIGARERHRALHALALSAHVAGLTQADIEAVVAVRACRARSNNNKRGEDHEAARHEAGACATATRLDETVLTVR